MEPLITQGLLGLGATAGNIGGNFFTNMLNNRHIMQLNQKIWEREDTAIRRQMRDLKAAGINPMLAGALGGATTNTPISPSQMQMPNLSQDIATLGNAISTQKLQKEQAEKAKAETTNILDLLETNEKEREKIEAELNLMSTQEKHETLKMLKTLRESDNIYADTLLKQAQKTLAGTQNNLTLKQIDELTARLEDRNWYNENMRPLELELKQIEKKHNIKMNIQEWFRIMLENEGLSRENAFKKMRNDTYLQDIDIANSDTILGWLFKAAQLIFGNR